MADGYGTSEGVAPPPKKGEARTFPCEGCGADLEFHIEQQKLACPHCGFTKEIQVDPDASVEERDLQQTLTALSTRRAEGHTEKLGDKEVHCDACGATIVFEGNLTSQECSYCGSPLQIKDVHEAEDRLPVDGVLPFMVPEKAAAEELKEWVKSRWFAPNDFKQRGAKGKFSGMYFPYWTFDAMTQTAYRGERGEVYYVTVGSGDNKRREQRIRWHAASGSFGRFFDDVLVCAATAIKRELIRKLEPWPLQRVKPFTPDVMAGYLAMTYDLALDKGFGISRERMKDAIEAEVKRRIGGDRQRIHSINTNYGALTYKHLLMPIWMLAYRYNQKSYQVFVNACTGEVQGERPWSWLKIGLAVAAGLAVVGTIAYLKATSG